MQTTKTKTVTKDELDSTYKGDSLNIHDELLAEFRLENPDATNIETQGEESANIDSNTLTYILTIQYEI